MNRSKTMVWTWLVLLLAAPLAGAEPEPEVLVELSRDRVYQGESVLYRVTLNHVENPSPPELAGFDDFEVTPAGERSLDSRQVFIINGRRTETIRRGRAYDYQLTPRKAGLLQIPAPIARIGGQVLRGRQLSLEVIAPEDQDVVRLEITSDRPSVYPMQPFTVTLTIFVKELPGAASQQEPVAVQRTPPAVTIPWGNDESLPDGLEPTVGWRQWLGPLQSGRAGFSINNLQRDSVFSLFEERSLLAFRPEPKRVQRLDPSGNQVGYWQYRFERTFVGKRAGRYRFGPVSLKGTFATGLGSGGELAGEGIYAVAQAIDVDVRDVPEAGRPASYIGAVGRFRLEAELTPKQAKVGDPLTLTLTLIGQGTLEAAVAPDLANLPEIADRFRVYEATEETRNNGRRFTYSLRPEQDGIEEFPSVPVAYFDVEAERFVTLRTDPIPIRVTRAEHLSEQQIVSTPRNGSGASRELDVRREGIYVVNVADPAAVHDQSIRPGCWLLGLGGLAGLYAVVAVIIVQARRLRGDKALLRRRNAAAKARRRMREALHGRAGGPMRHQADRMQAALVRLVADVADAPEAGLTAKDACRLLDDFGVEKDLVARADSFLQTCDAVQYGASPASGDDFGREAETLLETLINALKAKRLFR
ncbi:MAG: BatD family protein [Pirellulales bacterium]|nr:BatD family protein [Pirellulales bacterium]